MGWTKEEIESLYNLLFSTDESNVLLAIALIKAKGEIEPFTAAIAFIDAFENDTETRDATQELLKEFLSAEELADWGDSLRIVDDAWMFPGKTAFTKSLEAYKEKMHIFDQFIKRAPQYAYIYQNIGNRILGNFKKKKLGLEYFRKAVELDPDSYEANFDYANHLPAYKKYADEKIKHYQRCIDISDAGDVSFDTYRNLGYVYASLKKMPKKAIEVFKEALKAFSGSVHTMVRIAYAINHIGEFEEARIALEDALALDDNYALAHNNYAFLLWNSYQEYDLALEHINKALKIEPKNSTYLHTLAEVEWYGFKNKEKALEALYKAKEADKWYKAADEMIEEVRKV